VQLPEWLLYLSESNSLPADAAAEKLFTDPIIERYCVSDLVGVDPKLFTENRGESLAL